MKRNDRGAAVVEFAIVLPLLVSLLVGIAEFGRAYYVQTTLSGAAREGVRVMAVQDSSSEAKSAAISAAGPLEISDITVATRAPSSSNWVPSNECSTAYTARVTIRYTMPYITGMFGSPLDLKGEGVMRCGG